MNALEILKSRGLVAQLTDEQGLSKLLSQEGVVIYVGFDPTADSLHVGHLLPIMALAQLQRWGHQPIAIIGGATAMIGDPSGKSNERQLLSPEAIEHNMKGVQAQLERFLDFKGPHPALVLNNADWIGAFSYIDWLREVGKYFSVNMMIAKESVRRRLEDRKQGISYTEFSYMLLQAYDFLYLFEHYGCQVQAGGQDQWGNMTAGIDLVRRKTGKEVYGLTFPLMTTANGEKFGKTAGNAVWLDPKKTSPYQFYQYWMQSADSDVQTYLKAFTFLSLEEIQEIVQVHRQRPEARWAQRRLAEEVTRIVHGQEALDRAIQASQALFGGQLKGMSASDLLEIFKDVPSTALEVSQFEKGIWGPELFALTHLVSSKGEARRLIQSGGLYVNNKPWRDLDARLDLQHLIDGKVLVLRKGKKKYHLVKVSE